MHIIPQVLEDIDWIRSRWEHLLESVEKGSPRPWRQPTLDKEARAELDARARAEKRSRGAFVLGESPAPIHLDALDTLTHATHQARVLAIELATIAEQTAALVHLHHTPSNPAADLDFIKAQLGEADLDELAHIGRTVAGLRRRMAAQFGEVSDGQHIDADCPWCNERQMRIRLIGAPDKKAPVVRCESGKCEPPAADCGARHRGHPIWPLIEWDWLAGRIDHHADKQQKAQEKAMHQAITGATK